VSYKLDANAYYTTFRGSFPWKTLSNLDIRNPADNESNERFYSSQLVDGLQRHE